MYDQFYYAVLHSTSLTLCYIIYVTVFQKFRSVVISAFKSFKIDHDEYQKIIWKVSIDSAKVVWSLITLSDPMLLQMKTAKQLKTEKESYDSNKFILHSTAKTRNKDKEDCFEIDAYAYPMLINSCEGKTIQKAFVFVREKN